MLIRRSNQTVNRFAQHTMTREREKERGRKKQSRRRGRQPVTRRWQEGKKEEGILCKQGLPFSQEDEEGNESAQTRHRKAGAPCALGCRRCINCNDGRTTREQYQRLIKQAKGKEGRNKQHLRLSFHDTKHLRGRRKEGDDVARRA